MFVSSWVDYNCSAHLKGGIDIYNQSIFVLVYPIEFVLRSFFILSVLFILFISDVPDRSTGLQIELWERGQFWDKLLGLCHIHFDRNDDQDVTNIKTNGGIIMSYSEST